MTAPATRPPKRERLVAAARELVYRQGVARTTLADIAATADVLLGNVYYYFKTKDDIIGAVVDAQIEQLAADIAALDRRHRSPKARLKALVNVALADRRAAIARYGCPFGTLCTEIAKHDDGSDPTAAALMQISLDWAEQQFRTMGRPDAHDLAVEFIVALQGTTVLASALGQPDLVARQTRRIERWIDSLTARKEAS